ncbi:hypothetical protein SESBI_40262 [Sesbania bispinosa]|nr:hypothetical protein SESBI_40262 [Sesbania bispinosa]
MHADGRKDEENPKDDGCSKGVVIEIVHISKLTDIKLDEDGENYVEWKYLVEISLGGMGKDYHLTQKGPTNPRDAETWTLHDKKIFALMINSVERRTQAEIYRPKQNKRKLMDYFLEFKKHTEEMQSLLACKTIDEMITQQQKLIALSWLSELDPDYEVVQSQILSSNVIIMENLVIIAINVINLYNISNFHKIRSILNHRIIPALLAIPVSQPDNISQQKEGQTMVMTDDEFNQYTKFQIFPDVYNFLYSYLCANRYPFFFPFIYF